MFILQLLILQVALFAGLVFILRRLMARPLLTAKTHLEGLSQDYLRKQGELKTRLEGAERQYQERLANAQEEAARLKTQALGEADVIRQQATERAHREAEQIVQQAMQAREALVRELTQSTELKVMEQACRLIQEVLPRQLHEASHRQWLDELLTNGLLSLERFETREDIHEACVVSAFPLTRAQRELLLERLGKALKAPIALQESVDPRLIAGLRLTLGHMVVDGSLASKLQEAARHAQDASD